MGQKNIAMLGAIMAMSAVGLMGMAPPTIHTNKPLPGGYRSNRKSYHAPGWHPKKNRNRKGRSR